MTDSPFVKSTKTEFGLAIRQLRRECRLSEYLVLICALVLSVASVTSVGFFANRVDRAMALQAATMLAADASLGSPQRLADSLRERATENQLAVVDVVEFPSVVLNDDGDTALVSVKAVSDGYPLRGEVRLSRELYATDRAANGVPNAGEVWIDPRLAGALSLQAGGNLSLGEISVRASDFIAFEPDAAGDVFQMAPRLIMNAVDLNRSGLLGEGSRARFKLLVAGERENVAGYTDWIDSLDNPNLRLQTVEQGQPRVQSALLNVRRFLGLAAAVAVLLSGVAVALAARQIAERDMDTSALLRAFGADSTSVVRIILIRLTLIAAIAALLGSAIGFVVQFGLSALLAQWFATELPAPSLLPLAGGITCAVLALAGFCLPAVLKAVDTPVVRVLHRDMPVARPSTWLVIACAVMTMFVLLWWLTRDPRIGGILVVGLLAVVGILWLISRSLVALSGRARSPALRRALEGIRRRPDSVSLQISAYSVGLLALLLLAIVRMDVLANWQRQIPEEAPNFFMVNIQPDEVDAIGNFFSQRGIDSNTLFPMIRGRLEAINDRRIGQDDYNDERAKRMSERDYNLSYQAEMRLENKVVAGEWWPAETNERYFSVEEDFAADVGIELGDTLHFRVAEKQVSGVVTNLREVEWESFAVNFFVVGSPASLRSEPASFVTSIFVEDNQASFVRDVVKIFPSVTVLEVGSMIERVTGILDRAALAVQYVFVFTLIAGILVLIAAVLASRRERFHEAAILRTLGASRRYLALGMAREFVLIGALAGFIASSIASILAWLIVDQVMTLEYHFNGELWLAGILAGIIGIWFAGTLASVQVLRQSPMAVIRSQV